MENINDLDKLLELKNSSVYEKWNYYKKFNKTHEDIKDIDFLIYKKLLELKKSRVNEKWNYYKMYNQIDKKIKDLDSLIYKKCNHIWVIKYSRESYGRAEHICIFCNLYRNHFIYNS